METKDLKSILRSKGEKATRVRVNILAALSREKYPLSIKEISKKIRSADQSTLYRSLGALAAKGLVREILLDKEGARYEISIGRKHHHHALCTSCGFIQDIRWCEKDANAKARKAAKGFFEITGHSLEFFGICGKCVKKQPR